MSWLDKLLPPRIQHQTNPRRVVPEGLWVKCPSCEAVLYRTDLESNAHVCPECSHHMRIRARDRLNALLDPEGRYDVGHTAVPYDSLKFRDSKKYPDRLKAAEKATGETDALIVVGGSIKSLPVVVACFEFEFMGGSMGSVVGERFVRGVREAMARKVPFICITAQWRRPHAGRVAFPDANGENQHDSNPSGRRETAVYLRSDRSDNGWGVRFLSRLWGISCWRNRKPWSVLPDPV